MGEADTLTFTSCKKCACIINKATLVRSGDFGQECSQLILGEAEAVFALPPGELTRFRA